MPRYLIISDIDGTLTANHHDVTPKTAAAIAAAVASGASFYVATGRMHALAQVVAKQFEPEASIIASNGAVYDFPASGCIMFWGKRHLRRLKL